MASSGNAKQVGEKLTAALNVGGKGVTSTPQPVTDQDIGLNAEREDIKARNKAKGHTSDSPAVLAPKQRNMFEGELVSELDMRENVRSLLEQQGRGITKTFAQDETEADVRAWLGSLSDTVQPGNLQNVSELQTWLDGLSESDAQRVTEVDVSECANPATLADAIYAKCPNVRVVVSR